jgi:hypothetical protein
MNYQMEQELFLDLCVLHRNVEQGEDWESTAEEYNWTLKEKTIRGWRKLHNEKCHHSYASLDNTRVTKSRKMRWTERVTTTKDIGNNIKTDLKEIVNYKRNCVHFFPRHVQVEGSSEHGKEHNYVNSWNWVLLQKPPVAQILKKFGV